MSNHESLLLDELVVLDWRDLAACADYDPDLFFPAGETGPAADQIRRAKEVCASCEVQEDCLEYAIETNQVAGVWGGLTEDERRPVRRRWLADRRRRTVA
jgi:WhiB family transcriptional regulator, redox-sensing transcriptional regulator